MRSLHPPPSDTLARTRRDEVLSALGVAPRVVRLRLGELDGGVEMRRGTRCDRSGSGSVSWGTSLCTPVVPMYQPTGGTVHEGLCSPVQYRRFYAAMRLFWRYFCSQQAGMGHSTLTEYSHSYVPALGVGAHDPSVILIGVLDCGVSAFYLFCG